MKSACNRWRCLGLCGLLLCLVACSRAPDSAVPSAADPDADVVARDFAITGMTCEGCVRAIHHAVAGLDGVHRVEVTLEPQAAAVTYEPGRIEPADIIGAIEKLGYRVSLQ